MGTSQTGRSIRRPSIVRIRHILRGRCPSPIAISSGTHVNTDPVSTTRSRVSRRARSAENTVTLARVIPMRRGSIVGSIRFRRTSRLRCPARFGEVLSLASACRYAMETHFKGRVWTFGDDISTDHIIAGKYLGTTDSKVFAEHAFEAVDPTWAKNVRPGDMIVAGANFGCGSSREQAPVALKTLGISAILANSFARIFFRNAINLGFPVVECPGLKTGVKSGDIVELDMARGEVHLPGGPVMRFKPLPPNVLEILEAGGLVPKLRKELATKSAG